jgi:hypothetical protein
MNDNETCGKDVEPVSRMLYRVIKRDITYFSLYRTLDNALNGR